MDTAMHGRHAASEAEETGCSADCPAKAADFYADLPAFEGLDGLTDPSHYRDIPSDWVIFVTDVRGSTAAVATGLYKQVNTIGAATIIVAQNACPGVEFPFVFGGDGATLAVPASAAEVVATALCGLAQKAQQEFGLILRVGRVPVGEVRARGKQVRVAKRELSPGNCIAMFSGGGLSEATEMIKSADRRWLADAGPGASARMDGLECRWNVVPARNGSVLSLILWAPDADRPLDLYRQLLSALLEIAPQPMPVTPSNLPVQWPPAFLMDESKMKHRGRVAQCLHYAGVLLLTALLTLIVKRTRTDQNSAAARYIEALCRNSDYLKLDDFLRMVIDVSEEQRVRIETLLERYRVSHGLHWGAHHSSSSVFTCMVRSQETHLHFVDGNDGGYTAAARDMAARMGRKK